MARILVIDDEVDLLKALAMILRARKHEVTPISDGGEAQRLLRSKIYDLVISDIRMTPVDGLQMLSTVQEVHPETPVILITAYATLDVALDAIKSGAFDFVTKPFRTDNFLATVQRALDYPHIVSGNIQLDPPDPVHGKFMPLVVKSPSMQALCHRLEQQALTDEAVLILGERGAGKRQVAQILHALSRRKDHPFVFIDCSMGSGADLSSQLWGSGGPAVKAGVLEAAAAGTVLLEYIEELSTDHQPRILRLIKEREYVRPGDMAVCQADIRVLATSRSLPTIQPGDDYQRMEWIQMLTAISLRVPPLRERSADLLSLISRRVYQRADPTVSKPWKVSAPAYDILDRYLWPGNVEELNRVLDLAMTSARHRLIDLSDLPPAMIETVSQMITLSQQNLRRDELRGKSFRDYVRLKQKELSPVIRTGNGMSASKT
ncbi:MAG: sigma 54-interacting transcriptional regulator [Verrucomicrobia bacterium]|nr:sigma 54-interacting transcriptional regulator [Verrucomicrobiota bacterium]MCG2680233.1 sigma 54-interacting transcriptional regulator [Kiritimatiellia bacterium]MBU4247674.1 sigma 54-interacting transcriptional regulator [Verrucomicrobiota bacterium]MBU4289802.1 sigma 54-interacting transcriptional regulator [Verrucomicrobiota bacterium]MBU4428055.1 sigma 54-interacting transcriptional regulator [Verrucomicrobiota bacterium]